MLMLEFNEFPKLESDNFRLREVKDQDYKEIYEIYGDEEAVRYQQIEPMSSVDQGKKAVVAFHKGYENKKFIRWGITDKKVDKVIGLITLHNFDEWNLKAEIGYMLNRKYWRLNVMSEVGEKVIEYAFEVIKLHRIEASIHLDNIASINLSKKLGFKREGLRRGSAYNRRTKIFEDRLIYGLVKDK